MLGMSQVSSVSEMSADVTDVVYIGGVKEELRDVLCQLEESFIAMCRKVERSSFGIHNERAEVWRYIHLLQRKISEMPDESN